MTHRVKNFDVLTAPANMGYRSTGTVALADGETATIPAFGASRFRMVELSTDCKISVDDGAYAPIRKGMGARFNGLVISRHIQVFNDSGGAITFELAYGTADVFDDRTFLTSVTISGEVTPSRPSTIVTATDISATAGASSLIWAAEATRREIMLGVPSSATLPLRFGDGNVAAARGIEVQPGSTLTLAVTSSVYCWNPNAAAVAVSRMDLR